MILVVNCSHANEPFAPFALVLSSVRSDMLTRLSSMASSLCMSCVSTSAMRWHCSGLSRHNVGKSLIACLRIYNHNAMLSSSVNQGRTQQVDPGKTIAKPKAIHFLYFFHVYEISSRRKNSKCCRCLVKGHIVWCVLLQLLNTLQMILRYHCISVILRSIGQYCCHKIWRMASEMIFSARWHSFIDNLLNRLNFKSISVMSCIRLVVFICRHTTMMC